MRRLIFRFAVAIVLLLLLALPPASLAAKRVVWAYQGKAAFFEENGRIGLVTKGMGTLTTVAPLLDEVTPFYSGIANVRQDNLWGLLSQEGVYLRHPFAAAPIEFSPFDNQYGFFQLERGSYGLLNRGGEIILEPIAYLEVGPVSEGVFAAKTEQGYGYITVEGQTAVGFQYDAALPFTEGAAAVRKEGLWGYIDHRGQMVLGFGYVEASHFSRGLAAVRVSPEASTVYINPQGEVVLSGNWDAGYPFTGDGLARVTVEGKYGYINLKGRLVIDARYRDAGDFGNGFAAVRAGETGWQYIDGKGKVISKTFLSAGPFRDGFAYVTYQADARESPVTGYINTGRKFVCQELN